MLIVGRGLSADKVKSVHGGDFEVVEELPSVAITHAGAPSFYFPVSWTGLPRAGAG
jgi:hypothetical protein